MAKQHVSPTFDIYLVKGEESLFDANRLVNALLGDERLRPDITDPGRHLYVHPDTGVFFTVVLAPEVASLWKRRLRRMKAATEEGAEGADEAEGALEDPGSLDDEGEHEGTREEHEEVLGDDGEEGSVKGEATPEEESSGDEERGGEEEAPEEEEEIVELPPVSINVPLFCPSFFPQEAVEFARGLAEAGGLAFDHPFHRGDAAAPEGAEDAPLEHVSSPSEILARWEAENRGGLPLLKDAAPLTVWSREKALAWWNYGMSCAALEAELGKEGVHVPRLQAAVHEGRTKTICVWDVSVPTVLPRTDLVLVRVERQRKGLLWSRKVVEEGLATGEKIWDILATFSEIRREPVDLLVFREARKPPSQVAAELEVLQVLDVETARRAGLVGVVDFSLDS